MSTESRKEQHEREFARLNDTLRELNGTRASRVAWSYGDELHVELSHRTEAVWAITTQASRWLLLSSKRLVAHDRDPKDAELSAFKPLEGAAVSSAEMRFEDYALTVNFDNGYRFVILTIKRRRTRLPDLPLWQLYTPSQVVIDVQPNGDIDFYPGEVVDDVAYRRRMRQPKSS